jgi:cytochrome P450
MTYEPGQPRPDSTPFGQACDSRAFDDSARPAVDWDPDSLSSLDDLPSALADLRARCPVAYTQADGGFYALTRYADIVAAARDPAIFSSAAAQLMPELRRIPLELDPPEHSAFRRILQPYFSAARVEQLEPRVRHFAADLLQPLIARGAADIAAEFTFPFPTRVLCAALNIPDQDWAQLKLWAGEVRPRRSSDATQSAPRPSGNDAFLAYAREMIASRRVAPLDQAQDITSGLLAARIDGQPLSDERILGILRLLLSAGHNSTTISLGILIAYVAARPDLQMRLRAHSDLIPRAVEEILRFETPVVTNANPRVLTRDLEIRGRRLNKGDRVALVWGSGNRDAEAFGSVDECLIERSPNRHLAFGHGIHVCVGAPVARQELRIALEELLSRTQSFVLDGNVVRGAWWRQRGPVHLPLKLQAREAASVH